ncbi:MAG: LacI family DNA-binding transcriptional regulator [Cyclobacteriaceae bacterium]|nr:LacI family DNA-binding transcriptional regulator [Cyclobacteriaceae bacterium]
MAQKVTIYDIAKALDLTPATVSRALNDSYEISESTKEKVRALARQLNYQPNRMASGLRSKRNKMIGILVPNIAYHFNSSAIAGIEEVLGAQGYRTIICQTHEKLDREIENLKDLVSIRVDGLIASLSAETLQLDHFQDLQMPLVFIDRVPIDDRFIRIHIDNEDAAYKGVQHLLQSGRKHIAWLAGPEGLDIAERRYRGYCRAHQEAETSIDPQLKIHFHFKPGDPYHRLRQTIQEKPAIDAVFSINDRIAIEALAAIRDAGKSVPQDIAVMGFNNESISPWLYPSLSSVSQPSFEMGREAALQLLGLIKGQKMQSRSFVFETHIVERGSTLPVLVKG